MKKFIYLSLIGFLALSCGGGKNDATPTPVTPQNVAPAIPTLVAPTNNKLCVDNSVGFRWNIATDGNNDAVVYQMQVSKDQAFTQIVKTLDGAAVTQLVGLDKNTAYYWRVKATDSKGLSSDYSTVYKFYTQGDAVVNHLPFAPDLVSPVLNSVLTATTATLSWTATDVDATDKLTYDVYFGTSNPPTKKVGDNQATNTLDVAIVASTEYFWKVIVKDNKGGETVGQIWKFKMN
jgi:hypothetical protein